MLQPDPSTSCGQKVANFVHRLDNMNIVLLTMGSVINEDVTIDMKMPAPVKQRFKSKFFMSSLLLIYVMLIVLSRWFQG